MLASGTRAPIDPNHQDDVPHVSACGRKRQAMPLPKLSHPVCLQPPCASSCSLAWTDIVFHDRTDRPERVLCVGLATLARLTTPVAEKLTDSILTGWVTRVDGPLDVDFQLASARGRSTHSLTSKCGCMRLMVAVPACELHAWLISS